MQRFGYYLMPPPKKMKWSRLHTFMMIMMVIHFGLLVFFGKFAPKIFNKKTNTYVVNIIKDVKTKKKEVKKAAKKQKQEKPKIESVQKKKDTARKKDYPKKTKPNKPLKIDLPKHKYPTIDPKSQHKIYKKQKNAHEDGAPSGDPDGVLGSNGTGGEGFGPGGGEGGGAGGGSHPWVYLAWTNLEDIRQFSEYGKKEGEKFTADENIEIYADQDTCKPYLISTPVPNYGKMIGLGTGAVDFRVTITDNTDIPYLGGPPTNIRVLDVRPDKPDQKERLRELAIWVVENSGWYPAKKDGEPYETEVEFTLYFYTGEDE